MSNEVFTYTRNINKNPKLNIWHCFPSKYSFGMASLGYLSIFKTLDLNSEYFVERIFTDTQKTKLKFKDVDIMSFSVSFEIDFLAILQIMEKYKIPFKSKDRDESFPLITGGGPVLTSNPEPFAEFFDYIALGDAEEIDEEIFDVVKNNINLPKTELLEKLSHIQGVYVPSLKENKDYKAYKKTSKIPKCVATPILTEDSYFSNSYIIEVARGCPQQCGFCMASYLNLPVRFADYEQIIKHIDLGLTYTNKIAFLGALIAAHPRFEDLCKYIYEKKQENNEIEFSISSLRVDSITSSVIKTLVACGQRHATIAIEAGSERLRKIINKNLKEEQIFEAVKIAQDNGLKGFKIYAMIGLPTETKEDIKELLNLAKKLKNTFKNFDFTYSFSTFVPKAHTPFQFEARESVKSLEAKYTFLKKEFHKAGIKIRCSSVKWDNVQAIFSMGDRYLSDYAIEVYKQGATLGIFKNTYSQMSKKKMLPKLTTLLEEKKNFEDILPWEHIIITPGKSTLWKEKERLINIS